MCSDCSPCKVKVVGGELVIFRSEEPDGELV